MSLRLSLSPNGLREAKACRSRGIVASSPRVHRNSSKSIGRICARSSSLGMRMSLVFLCIKTSEPVSM